MSESRNGIDGLDELAGSDPLSGERLRRMKAMIRQIHREEYEAKIRRLPPIKGRTLIFSVSFISIILFGITAFYHYNLLIALEEKVRSTQGHLDYALQRRANLFDNLVNVALNQAALEREIFHLAGESRAALKGLEPRSRASTVDAPGDLPPSAGMSIPAGMNPLERLMALVEQYPDVKVSTSYQQLMDKLVEMEDRISQRADEHNEQVRIYNTMIESYPSFIMARAVGFNRYSYYHTEVSYEDHPKLTTETFRSLLPPQRQMPKNGATLEVKRPNDDKIGEKIGKPMAEAGQNGAAGDKNGTSVGDKKGGAPAKGEGKESNP
ncbi:MAG: LemA family protein [Magnetococcales bacterium]|nr:LemA family protein [Magnetococcales bacterium]